jgi:hypothetical protein
VWLQRHWVLIYNKACVGLGTVAITKTAVGFTRLYAFWENISGFWDGMKVVMSFERVLKEVPEAANKVSSLYRQVILKSNKNRIDDQQRIWPLVYQDRHAGSRY